MSAGAGPLASARAGRTPAVEDALPDVPATHTR